MVQDVFISASSSDKDIAGTVCAHLEAAGLTCWIAPRDILPGQNWGEAIVDAINGSRTMVLVYSDRANESPQIVREVERAVNKNIPIVPFRIEDAPLSKALEYFISSPHWLDAFSLPLEPHLERLEKTVRRLLQKATQPAVGLASERADNSAIGLPVQPQSERFKKWLWIVPTIILGCAIAGGVKVWKNIESPGGDKTRPPDLVTEKLSPKNPATTTRASTQQSTPRTTRAQALDTKIDAQEALEQIPASQEEMFNIRRSRITRSLRVGDGFYDAREYDDAIAKYQEAIRESRSLTALLQSKHAATIAIDAAKALLKSVPTTGPSRAEKGRKAGQQKIFDAGIAMASEDFEAAREAGIEAQNQFKLAQEAIQEAAQVAESAKQFNAALKSQDTALLQQDAPAEWKALQDSLRLAQAAEKNGDYSAAIDAYARAGEFLVQADHVLQLTKERKTAELTELKRRRDEQIARLLETAKRNDSKEKSKAAVSALEELLRIDPGHAEATRLREKISAYWPRTYDNRLKMSFTEIKAGEFMMGTPADEEDHQDDEVLHKVRITKPFLMGKHEVTVAQFAEFAKTGYVTEAEQEGKAGFWSGREFEDRPGASWRNTGFPQAPNHPVVNLTWKDATKFCEWLTGLEGKKYRLPTEAEWEFTCRAGSRSTYPWGTNKVRDAAPYANVADRTIGDKLQDALIIPYDDRYFFTAPVGSFKPNTWDVYDMVGNVWEWCSDTYGPYPRGDITIDPKGAANGTLKVLRGGAYYAGPSDYRPGYRRRTPPTYRFPNVGFRVVVELP